MRSLWLVSREYAGLAEAGGVKNVARSLCEGLIACGIETTLFIPLYGCTDMSSVEDFTRISQTGSVTSIGRSYTVGWATGRIGSVSIVFVIHELFEHRRGVYTYTADEEAEDASHKRGTGHYEAPLMNVIFQKAVLAYGSLPGTSLPDIIHCQDATAALVPVFALCLSEFRLRYSHTRCLVTIHNAGDGYRHTFASKEAARSLTGLPDEVVARGLNPSDGSVEPFLLSGSCSCLTTVSPWYADELIEPDMGTEGGFAAELKRMRIPIIGITNGIDYDRYAPEDSSRSLLPHEFAPCNKELAGKYACREELTAVPAKQYAGVSRYGSVSPSGEKSVWFSYHGRLVVQKGLDILANVIPDLLSAHPDYRFVINGQGDAELEQRYADIAERFSGQCLYFRGYDRALARLTTASGDFLVLPSNFEPCGLEDFIGQIYGTIPIAHATGGLHKIIHGETGFLYSENTAEKLRATLEKMADLFYRERGFITDVIKNGAVFVRDTYPWSRVIERQYLPLYRHICTL